MLIGISGKMGTGKTTLANHLASQYHGSRVSFADELRSEIEEYFGVDQVAMRDPAIKNVMMLPVGYNYKPLRELMQWWGTVRREANPSYWVDRLLGRVVEMESAVIIDDVRYHNEAEAIRRIGGTLVRLDPYPGWQPGTGAGHASETELDDYDYFDYRFAPKYGALFPLAYELRKNI